MWVKEGQILGAIRRSTGERLQRSVPCARGHVRLAAQDARTRCRVAVVDQPGGIGIASDRRSDPRPREELIVFFPRRGVEFEAGAKRLGRRGSTPGRSRE